MDVGGFETLTLSIELAIDWPANSLIHHGSVTTLKTLKIYNFQALKLQNIFFTTIKNGF